MKASELEFEYPQELIATEPKACFRTLYSQDEPHEISKSKIFDLFQPGDILAINISKVQKRRVFSEENLEVLFLNPVTSQTNHWEVLFPAKKIKIGQKLLLPGAVSMTLVQKGRPQQVEVSEALTDSYFESYGELALPPYIQEARQQRHMKAEDENWYQTHWAQELGSCAAPTASLHFTQEDINLLKSRGVEVVPVTLHVGMGTFLPIKSEDLSDHQMHKEWVSIAKESLDKIKKAKDSGARVWALGTTVLRSLESWRLGLLGEETEQGVSGETDLFVKPGFEFQAVDMLMTNFHQPRSTLLALVMAFAGQSRVLEAYKFAVENKFRLFSYGDLSIWKRQ